MYRDCLYEGDFATVVRVGPALELASRLPSSRSAANRELSKEAFSNESDAGKSRDCYQILCAHGDVQGRSYQDHLFYILARAVRQALCYKLQLLRWALHAPCRYEDRNQGQLLV